MSLPSTPLSSPTQLLLRVVHQRQQLLALLITQAVPHVRRRVRGHDAVIAHRLAALVHVEVVRLVCQLVELVEGQGAWGLHQQREGTCSGRFELCQADAQGFVAHVDDRENVLLRAAETVDAGGQ